MKIKVTKASMKGMEDYPVAVLEWQLICATTALNTVHRSTVYKA